MDQFIAWLNNSLVQSAIISPLVGTIFGVMFAGLNNPPSPAAPVTVKQTVIIFKQTIVVNQNGGNAQSRDDAAAYLIAMIVFVAGITWGYSRYSAEVLGYWLNGLFSATAFVLSAAIASAIRGQYSSREWGWYILTPIIGVGFSFYLVYLANAGVILDAREAAQSHGFIEFYFKVLDDKNRRWLILQIAGVFFGMLVTLIAAFRSVHYLALMNQRTAGKLSSFWYFLARITLFAGRTKGVVFLFVMAVMAYLALSGNAYELLPSGK